MNWKSDTTQFAQFVMSLGTAALAYLGKIEDPDFKDIPQNLDLAKYNIDILLMLREKTKGNLSDEEAKMLNSLLYDLQMNYLEENK